MVKIDLDYFEKIIFCNSLKNNSPFLASCIEYLDKELFKDKDIGVIMEIIKSFYLEHSAIPTVTELKVRVASSQAKAHLEAAVKMIRGMDSDFNEEELIKNTEHFIRQRKLEVLLNRAIDEKATEKQIDLDSFQKESEEIHGISLINNLGLDYFAEIDRVVAYFDQKDTVFSSGYAGFDEAMGGGFFCEGKQFGCIGGETNVGKSIVLANIIVNVLLQNKNVLLYTLEMSEMRYAKRISSILTNIALANLPDNVGNFKDWIRDFVSQHMSRLIIKEFPTKSVSAKTLLAHAGLLKRRKAFEPNFIAFDYHGLLKPSVTQPSKHIEMQYITQECRGLTYLLNAPGCSVAQLNRSSHKQESPGLNSVAGSWDMISDEDWHVNIWQTDIDREANILRYIGEKARDGAKGHSNFWSIDYDTLKLTEDDTPPTRSVSDIDNVMDNFDFNS
jgi:replicative DNA helicase